MSKRRLISMVSKGAKGLGKLPKELYDKAIKNGGFTTKTDGTDITSGYSVSVLDYDQALRSPVDDVAVSQANIEKAIEMANDKGLDVGGWVSDGELYLDVVMVTPDRQLAEMIGKQNKQDAIFNLDTFEEISLKAKPLTQREINHLGAIRVPQMSQGKHVAQIFKEFLQEYDIDQAKQLLGFFEEFADRLGRPDVIQDVKAVKEALDEPWEEVQDALDLAIMYGKMEVNTGGYINRGRKVPVKLTKGEIVLPPEITDRNLAVLERMNEIGLQARAMGGVAAYKAAGGMIRHFQKGGFADWANENSDALGQVGNFLYKSAYNDPNAIDAFNTVDKTDKKLTPEEEKAKTQEEIRVLVQEASGLIQGAAQAGDFINGHNQELTEEEQAELNAAEEKGLGAKLIELGGAAATTLAGAFSGTAKVREEALAKIAYRKFPNSYRDYVRLKAVANKLVFPVLESGALGVNPTDADVELARQSMFDVTAPSSTWAAQLNDLAQRNGGERKIAEIAKATGSNPPQASASVDIVAGASPNELEDLRVAHQTASQGEYDPLSLVEKARQKVPKWEFK